MLGSNRDEGTEFTHSAWRPRPTAPTKLAGERHGPPQVSQTMFVGTAHAAGPGAARMAGAAPEACGRLCC